MYKDDPRWIAARQIYIDPQRTTAAKNLEARLEAIREMNRIEELYE